jgi:hypothetical protein
VQALSSAGDLVIPPRKAEMHPRIEWQRYKIDRNSVHVLFARKACAESAGTVAGKILEPRQFRHLFVNSTAGRTGVRIERASDDHCS